MKGRNAQVARIYKILNILEGAPQGLSVLDLCQRLHDRGFEVTKRTVYRDLEALRAAGFPLDEKGKTDENGTRWTLEKTTRISHYLILSPRELVGLYLARRMLAQLRDTPFFADLEATFNKIEEKLTGKGREYLREVAGEVHFESGPKWGLGLNLEIIETIRAACTERQLLKINYSSQSSGTTRDRIVGPHFLYFAKGSLYLVAHDIEAGKNKTFGLPRINSAHMLDEAFLGEPVDPDQHFGNAMGVYSAAEAQEVKLCFYPPVAQYISERVWHSTQEIVHRQRGEVELNLKVGITPELVQWVLGFGSKVKIDGPQGLIDKVHGEALHVFRLYGNLEQAS